MLNDNELAELREGVERMRGKRHVDDHAWTVARAEALLLEVLADRKYRVLPVAEVTAEEVHKMRADLLDGAGWKPLGGAAEVAGPFAESELRAFRDKLETWHKIRAERDRRDHELLATWCDDVSRALAGGGVQDPKPEPAAAPERVPMAHMKLEPEVATVTERTFDLPPDANASKWAENKRLLSFAGGKVLALEFTVPRAAGEGHRLAWVRMPLSSLQVAGVSNYIFQLPLPEGVTPADYEYAREVIRRHFCAYWGLPDNCRPAETEG